MKKSILSIAIVALLASCSNEKSTDETRITSTVENVDTIGLSDYKEWKQKQELQSTQQTYTSPGVNDVVEVPTEKPAPVVIYREAPARRTQVARSPKPTRQKVYKTPVEQADNRSVASTPPPPISRSEREPYGRESGTESNPGNGTTPSNDGNGDVAVNTPAPSEVPEKKDGWSKAAKGTAVGGASGAVIGAVISKNKTKGAVIGGIVGAAGGYIFGRNKDKKEARN